MDTILLSSYIGGEENRNKVRYLEGIDSHLKPFKCCLHLVNLSWRYMETSIKNTQVPRTILKPEPLGKVAYEAKRYTEEVSIAAELDAKTHNTSYDVSYAKLVLYGEFMEGLLAKQQPALCIIWNQFTSYHHILQLLCNAFSIPVLFMEYGLLPGTLSIEPFGQMAESWVSIQSDHFVNLPVTKKDLRVAKKYLEYAKVNKLNRKDPKKTTSILDVVSEIRSKKRKIILYAGQNDFNSGMQPGSLPGAKLHSPIFTDTIDALKFLSVLAEKNNWHILFKPHPNLENNRLDPGIYENERVSVVTNSDLMECFGESDLTATILSQVNYMSLIHDKPVLMLGRNQLSEKGCMYEARDQSEIEGQITAALENNADVRKEHFGNFRKHVAQLIKYYLFAFDDKVNYLIGRDRESSARFIASHRVFSSRFSGPKIKKIFNKSSVSTCVVFGKEMHSAIINGDFKFWPHGKAIMIEGETPDPFPEIADGWYFNNRSGCQCIISRESFIKDNKIEPNGSEYYIRVNQKTLSVKKDGSYLRYSVNGVRNLSGETTLLSFYAKTDKSIKISLAVHQVFGTKEKEFRVVNNNLEENQFHITNQWKKYSKTINFPNVEGKDIEYRRNFNRILIVLPVRPTFILDIALVKLQLINSHKVEPLVKTKTDEIEIMG